MLATCKDCGDYYEKKFEWAVRCYDCYQVFKAKTKPVVVTEYIQLSDADGQWLRGNIKDILMLCHPDHHKNDDRSNRITQKLLEIFRQ